MYERTYFWVIYMNIILHTTSLIYSQGAVIFNMFCSTFIEVKAEPSLFKIKFKVVYHF